MIPASCGRVLVGRNWTACNQQQKDQDASRSSSSHMRRMLVLMRLESRMHQTEEKGNEDEIMEEIEHLFPSSTLIKSRLKTTRVIY